MYAIEINKLTKVYNSSAPNVSKNALQAIDLKVEKGSIFGLLGPNGAGKSTLINILAGIVQKTSGKVEIMGVDIDTDPKLAKAKIGVVPQEIAIDTFFSLYHSLEFYAGYFGIRKPNRKTNEILEALGLIDKAHVTPRALSGGMKRRFLIAKAMVHSPEVLILDEPTAGVDLELRDQLWNYVVRLNKSGITVILTTHYLEEAEKLCDQIGFIDKGGLAFCDSKNKLLSTLSQKEVIVTLSSDLSDLPKNLLSYNATLITPNVLMIQYNKNQVAIGKIIADILITGLEIIDLQIKEGKLEDIFRQIYKK